MINASGFPAAHGMPAGIADREVTPPVSEVKTRIMTDEERAALDEALTKKKPAKEVKVMHLSPTGKQTRKEKSSVCCAVDAMSGKSLRSLA